MGTFQVLRPLRTPALSNSRREGPGEGKAASQPAKKDANLEPVFNALSAPSMGNMTQCPQQSLDVPTMGRARRL